MIGDPCSIDRSMLASATGTRMCTTAPGDAVAKNLGEAYLTCRTVVGKLTLTYLDIGVGSVVGETNRMQIIYIVVFGLASLLNSPK